MGARRTSHPVLGDHVPSAVPRQAQSASPGKSLKCKLSSGYRHHRPMGSEALGWSRGVCFNEPSGHPAAQ